MSKNEGQKFSIPALDLVPVNNHEGMLLKREVDQLTARNAELEAEVASIKSALRDCEKYFADRADAEYHTDSPSPIGNVEMRLLCVARNALKESGL